MDTLFENSYHKFHEGLRKVLRAFITSPVEGLYIEAVESSKNVDGKKLVIEYKSKSKPLNPA